MDLKNKIKKIFSESPSVELIGHLPQRNIMKVLALSVILTNPVIADGLPSECYEEEPVIDYREPLNISASY